MMSSSTDNTYAFDEVSLLHMCEITIPHYYIIFFDNERKLFHRNNTKLRNFLQNCTRKGISKFRFEPLNNFETNVIKVANQLLEKKANIRLLGNLKAQIIEQLEEFKSFILSEFKPINKDEDTVKIKSIFENNEIKLKKENNIPGEDDLKIISGYLKFDSKGDKFLISEDEHFWSYADLIYREFNIKIIPEWECDSLKL